MHRTPRTVSDGTVPAEMLLSRLPPAPCRPFWMEMLPALRVLRQRDSMLESVPIPHIHAPRKERLAAFPSRIVQGALEQAEAMGVTGVQPQRLLLCYLQACSRVRGVENVLSDRSDRGMGTRHPLPSLLRAGGGRKSPHTRRHACHILSLLWLSVHGCVRFTICTTRASLSERPFTAAGRSATTLRWPPPRSRQPKNWAPITVISTP